MHDAIAGVMQAEGVAHLDLFPAFRGKDPRRMQAIPRVDPHPNEIAHRIAAEAIFHFLLEQGLVPETYRPLEREIKLRARWEETAREYGIR
jgi:hypothetical protein